VGRQDARRFDWRGEWGDQTGLCRIPLLIAQGANDPRVKQAESGQIIEALRKAGKPLEYMLFPNEGHGFARPENRLKFYGAAKSFAAHLKRTGESLP
jgi:dipeptidyl aminopeptidase/acylaminoacyl peptidase